MSNKQNVKVNEKKEVLLEKTNKNKNKKWAFGILAPIFLIGFLSFHSYQKFEDKINSVSEEKVIEAKKILSLTLPENYKNYIENFNYTEEMYQEDLNKLNEIDNKIYSKYQDYLNYNNFSDHRSQEEFILDLKSKLPTSYIYLVEEIYMNLDYSDSIYSVSNYILYHDINEPLKTSEINESRLESVPYNKYSIYDYGIKKSYLKRKTIRTMKDYLKNNTSNPNIFWISDSHIFRYDLNNPNVNEGNEVVFDYFDKIKNYKKLYDSKEINMKEFNQKSTKIQTEFMLKMLNEEETMKETLRLLRATKNISEDFENLKPKDLNFKNGLIDDNLFVQIGFIMKLYTTKNETTGNVAEMIIDSNNYGDFNKDYLFKNDSDLKMNISGLNDYLLRDNIDKYYKEEEIKKNEKISKKLGEIND